MFRLAESKQKNLNLDEIITGRIKSICFLLPNSNSSASSRSRFLFICGGAYAQA